MRAKPFKKLDGKPVSGKQYHLSWGKKALIGRVVSVNEDDETVEMIAPVSKKKFKSAVKWSDLRLLASGKNQTKK